MAYEITPIELVGNNVVRINHPSLPTGPATYLTAAVAATGTNLTVRDNAGFSASAGGDLLLIGKFGIDQSEIKYVNGAITAGTGLTSAAVTYAHPINTPVRKVLFDKIEVYGNSSAASSGATLIATIDIDPSAPHTEYVVTGTTYAYYGARFIRSIATTYNGTYSDFIATAGFDTNTVGFIIKKAFDAVGKKIQQDGKFNKQWAFDQIFLGEQDVASELKKGFSCMQEFEYDMGNLTPGTANYTLPTNILDSNTPKAIQGLRIGVEPSMTYISKAEYSERMRNVAHTTVATNFILGAVSIVLTDSRDFADSGTLTFYPSGVATSVTYSANNRSTNTLTCTATSSAGTAADEVWQGETQGTPSEYTVYESAIHFPVVPDSTNTGRNIWLDYYKKITRVNSEGDTLTITDPHLIQLWLESMIKKESNGGLLDERDTSWVNYLRRKARFINNEVSGQGVYLTPVTVDADFDLK